MKNTKTKNQTEHFVDLTKRPPRSPRARLGGFVFLPRIIDKGRAAISGTLGEYHYGRGMDRHFFNFVGLDHEALKAEIARDLSDWELLVWIQENAKHKREPWEIVAWSQYHENRVPDSDEETTDSFASHVRKLSKKREDIRTWYDFLDLDDYCLFGGKA